MTLTQDELNIFLRRDFAAFVEKVFETVSPGVDYVHGAHIEAIAHLLELCAAGEMSRLIINQPPRSLKSIMASVAFPAWMLGRDPTTKIICVSYGTELAASLHRQFRQVVDSAWYKSLFPAMQVTRDTGTELNTSRHGGRYATSVGGTLTGRGAGIIVIDDPQKADEAQSEVSRRKVIDWYSNTLTSRLDNKRKGLILVVMQRLHEDDLSGHLLRQGSWDYLNLPAIATEDQQIPLSDGRMFIRRPGDVLQPEREGLAELERLKRDLGSLFFAAQYQQQPVPPDGNIVKRAWFNTYSEPPERKPGDEIIQSWDVAMTIGNASNYSVCTTWLKRNKDFYLLHVWRQKHEFPELKKKVISLAQHHSADVLLIEKAGVGEALIQQLRREEPERVPRPIAINPEADKQSRMVAQSAKIEAGQVHLPKEAGWLPDFLREILAFPNGRDDDQVDSLSQFLTWIGKRIEPSVGIGGVFRGSEYSSHGIHPILGGVFRGSE